MAGNIGWVKTRGNHEITKEQLCPEAYEYDRAVKVALLRFMSGIAKGLVRFGAESGLDVWRKLHRRYMPLAEDIHNMRMRELMILKPVTEDQVDT